MEDTRGNVRVLWHLNLVYSVSCYIFLRIQAYWESIALAF